MASHKAVATKPSSSRDVSADPGHQGPMSQQNADGFGNHDLHPQKMVQLVGCRDFHAQHQEPNVTSSSRRQTRVRH